jgi:hypothetical protein
MIPEAIKAQLATSGSDFGSPIGGLLLSRPDSKDRNRKALGSGKRRRAKRRKTKAFVLQMKYIWNF